EVVEDLEGLAAQRQQPVALPELSLGGIQSKRREGHHGCADYSAGSGADPTRAGRGPRDPTHIGQPWTRAASTLPSMETRRHLVCGTDFSEGAERALEVALEIAAATAARIALVHVCEPGLDGEVDDRRLRQCGDVLDGVVARHRRRPVELIGVL